MNQHQADIHSIVKDHIERKGIYQTGTQTWDLNTEIYKGDAENMQTLNELTQYIYGAHYAFNAAVPRNKYDAADSDFQNKTAAFTRFLSYNNQTPRRTDGGWVIEEVFANGMIRVNKNGCIMTLSKEHYESSGTAIAGGMVSRIVPKESTVSQPVFYYVFSEVPFIDIPQIMRFYWNIKPEAAGYLIKEITEQLNRYRVPFIYKCLNNPAYYDRRDSAVLYVCKQYYQIMNELLPLIYAKNAQYMVNDIPMFAQKLSKGLGYADSPISGDSFGMHRSRIVASGLIAATLRKATTVNDHVQDIYYQFERAHIDPAAPYITKDSKKVINPITL